MLVYVSGPYSAADDAGIDANIEAAAKVAAQLWEMGHTALCPHLNTARFEKRCPNVKYEDYIEGDLDLLSRCDAIVAIDGWAGQWGK